MIARLDLSHINWVVHGLDAEHEEGRVVIVAATRAGREAAADTAANCADCFRRLAPNQPAIMTTRNVGSARSPRWLYVPICRRCANRADRERALRNEAPLYRPPSWYETRCRNCRRPIRVCEGAYLATRTCCAACERRALYDLNNLRRQVDHQPIACVECGERFTPTRSDARFHSGRCRQAAHRRRHRRDG